MKTNLRSVLRCIDHGMEEEKWEAVVALVMNAVATLGNFDNNKPEPKPTGTVLEEAQFLVHGDRQKEYGSPAGQYQRVATMFNTLTGSNISAAQAAMFMILVKLDRENHKPKRDNRTDGAGYFAVLDMIRQEEPNPPIKNQDTMVGGGYPFQIVEVKA